MTTATEQQNITAFAGGFRVRFPYDARSVAAIRTVPGRRWDAGKKIWTVPNTPEAAAALSALASRLAWSVAPEAADSITVTATEFDDLLAMGRESGAVRECPNHDRAWGYRVRGGGAMLDGEQVYRVYRGRDDLPHYAEASFADRRSGSGRSGSVAYEIEDDGVFRVDTSRGSIASHSTDRQWHVRHRGQWYQTGRDTAWMLLGVDPAAARAAELRPEGI